MSKLHGFTVLNATEASIAKAHDRLNLSCTRVGPASATQNFGIVVVQFDVQATIRQTHAVQLHRATRGRSRSLRRRASKEAEPFIAPRARVGDRRPPDANGAEMLPAVDGGAAGSTVRCVLRRRGSTAVIACSAVTADRIDTIPSEMTEDAEPTTTTDPDGRSVELTAERWHHVLTGHPDLAPHRDAVLTCVSAPTIRRPGREANEWWHYLEDAGPSRWLKVVVAYEGDRGYVRTAFARRSFP